MTFDRKLWDSLPQPERILILYLMGAPIEDIAAAYQHKAWSIKKFLIQSKVIWKCPHCGRIYGLMMPGPLQQSAQDDSDPLCALQHWQAWESWHAWNCPQFRFDLESLHKEVIAELRGKR